MYNFTVKSIIHDYEVNFIEDTKAVLEQEIKEGDFIIIDNKIKELYKDELGEILAANKFIGIDATEPQKSYQGAEPVLKHLIENGFRKNHRLIAIGGGITQDITAFMSSILYRGVDWMFFPTSLLAQGDSCIGSKTSINFGDFKNLVGGFYPPNKIFINPKFLDTLSEQEMKSGLGEMLHYFIVSSEEDFRRFKNDYPQALTDKKVLAGIIARSLEIKKSYIERDEFDQNIRQVFNYGHTFGHAIESLTNYRIPHGIAVSYGMDMSNFVSVKLGYIPDSLRRDVRELVEKIWSGTQITDISLDKFTSALSKDKKNIGKQLGLILNKGYGKIFKDLRPMDDEFIGWLKEYFANELN
ncbi:AroB-related putative sugar phosphate phospholyase (cyclizing) [Foetidibacter luteolus]|uniref:AroB-related putative sugar phosphate phospholyase (cyclizing) n=1 Tax=Foetidibacter luteolus TaxID=2608880 RepID=UPI00129B397E|nr:AroB-related putative sugar phosphate phospholyase (cyclizing) [Foetidibacter luteolus]